MMFDPPRALLIGVNSTNKQFPCKLLVILLNLSSIWVDLFNIMIVILVHFCQKCICFKECLIHLFLDSSFFFTFHYLMGQGDVSILKHTHFDQKLMFDP